MSCGTVCSVIDEMLNNEMVAGDVRTLMTHYVEMVRRHIVDELDIDAVCQRLYREHGQAIRLIQERVLNQQKKIERALKRRVQQLVGQENALGCIHEWQNPDDGTPMIRFILPEWKNEMLHSKKWSSILKCVLELGVTSSPQQVVADLKIGPGNPSARQGLFQLAYSNDTFAVADPSQEYNQIYRRDLLSPEQYERLSPDMLVREAERQWNDFVQQDLPRIKDAIQQWMATKNA